MTDGTDDEQVKPSTFFRAYESKLPKAQKELARKRKGSLNRAKAKLNVAKLPKRIADLPANWLPQLTNRRTAEHELICLEALGIKGMAKTKLAKSVLDAASSKFVKQIDYKTLWRVRPGKSVTASFAAVSYTLLVGRLLKT